MYRSWLVSPDKEHHKNNQGKYINLENYQYYPEQIFFSVSSHFLRLVSPSTDLLIVLYDKINKNLLVIFLCVKAGAQVF